MVEDSKAARELSIEWAGIKSVGLPHARLFPFVKQLFMVELQAGETIAELRKECVNFLSRWISIEVEQGRARDKEWIPTLVEWIHQHPTYQGSLEELLSTWREAKFLREYESTHQEIDNALIQWDTDKARQSLENLRTSTLPSHLQERFNGLQEKIEQVEDSKRQLELLLGKAKLLEGQDYSINDWSLVPQIVNDWQNLQQLKTTILAMPNHWQQQVDQALSKLTTEIRNFLQSQAENCRDLAEVCIFYQHFKQLNVPDADFLEEAWFNQVKEDYQAILDRDMKDAHSDSDKLGRLMERTGRDFKDNEVQLPRMLVNWLKNLDDMVNECYRRAILD
ncbi:MAG: hypothetical protein BWK78_02550 [Thiotrichaceae bacterium IS1]|nr:MAG: hypothetical protein BWK78_02550 [Thiotrichaceae bacterium IS1]